MSSPLRASLAWRFTLLSLGLALTLLAGQEWIAWHDARTRTLTEAQEQLLRHAATLARSAESHWPSLPEAVRADLIFSSTLPGHRATLLTDAYGHVLLAHRRDWEKHDLDEVFPGLALPFPPPSLDAQRWWRRGDTLTLALPWLQPENGAPLEARLGWLILSYDFHTLLAQHLAEHHSILAWHAAFLTVLLLLLGFYLHHRGARPLSALTLAVRATSSPADYRLPDLRHAVPEVRTLGQAIAQVMASLAQQQEWLHQLKLAIDASPALIVITDTQPAIVYVNRAFTEVTGYRPDEVLGKNPRILQSGKTPRETYLDLWRQLTAGRRWSGDFINRRKDGSEYVEFADIAPIIDSAGRITHYVAVKFDLTLRRVTKRLSHLLTHDPLTGLANRSLLLDRIALRLAQSKENGQSFALLLVTLAGIDDVDEQQGLHPNEKQLREIGQLLERTLIAIDTLAHIEVTEFAVLTDAQSNIAEATYFGWQLARTLSHHIDAHIQKYYANVVASEHPTTATGVVVFPDDFKDAEEVLAAATLALQQARLSRQPGAVRVAESLGADLFNRRSAIERGLCEALSGQGEHSLALYYQGQFDQHRRLQGAEALLRFTHATLGRIPPTECISVAERSELIVTLSSWVLRTALADAMNWRTTGWDGTLSVNISPYGPRDPQFPLHVLTILRESGYPADRLLLEITEDVIVEQIQRRARVLHDLAAAGLHWSVDDFGTGYCGMHFLERQPISEVKIDISYVQRAPTDHRARQIIQATVDAASAFSCRIVAEGVENEVQAQTLTAWPEVLMQGWYLARPEPAEVFARRLGGETGQG